MVKKFGTRQQVWDEECTMTRGGLAKNDLVLSKAGRIVSKKNLKRLGHHIKSLDSRSAKPTIRKKRSSRKSLKSVDDEKRKKSLKSKHELLSQ